MDVRVSDLNYGAHVGGDSIINFCHQARVLLLKSIGANEMDFFGTALIMRNNATVQKEELLLGDKIEVQVFVSDFTPYGFTFSYRLLRQENQKEVARTQTAMVYFDYQKRSKVKKAEDIENALKESLKV